MKNYAESWMISKFLIKIKIYDLYACFRININGNCDQCYENSYLNS